MSLAILVRATARLLSSQEKSTLVSFDANAAFAYANANPPKRLITAHHASHTGFSPAGAGLPGDNPDDFGCTFLLTALTDADAIIRQQRRCGCNTIQLVDAVPAGTHARLREALPGIALVQVIHVIDQGSVEEALVLAPEVDALLLDSGNPALAVKELGGTGRVHDWALSRAIVERCGKPVFLAGGLRPDNVADAIRTVRPFGLDLCNGVRVDGRLDATRLAAFVAAAQAA